MGRIRAIAGGMSHLGVRMAYGARIRPVAWISLIVFIGSVIAGVVYLAHDRPKHGGAFIALAVVAAVVLYFTATPKPRPQ
jgi:uncharacterized membrane protein